MTRHSQQHSYGHAIKRFGCEHYRLSWTVDRYYEGSRLRYPTRITRDTDRAGAKRFADKWNVKFPDDPAEMAQQQ
jgi:hypothetical protein